jgi:zinc transport system ATP-binding protein
VKEEKKLAVLLVSHDLHFVFDYTDYVICLNQHICCHGHPETVKTTKDMQKLFPGFAPYHHHHDHEH